MSEPRFQPGQKVRHRKSERVLVAEADIHRLNPPMIVTENGEFSYDEVEELPGETPPVKSGEFSNDEAARVDQDGTLHIPGLPPLRKMSLTDMRAMLQQHKASEREVLDDVNQALRAVLKECSQGNGQPGWQFRIGTGEVGFTFSLEPGLSRTDAREALRGLLRGMSARDNVQEGEVHLVPASSPIKLRVKIDMATIDNDSNWQAIYPENK